MKNALILHGTEGHSQENWFPWLKEELEKRGYKVWVPDLPGADKPNVCTYNPFILSKWQPNEESVIIGHSSGATSILGLFNKLDDDIKVDKAILVAGFRDNLDWDALDDLFIYDFDWEEIKTKAKEFILLHSDDDPYVPLEQGEFLKKKLGAKLIVQKGQKHFSVGSGGEKFKKLPILLELLGEK